MRYCSAGVLWRGRCVLAWGIGEMWPKYGSTAGTFGVFPSWNFDALCFISMGFGGVWGSVWWWNVLHLEARWSHWVFRGQLARVANYTRVSILLHKIYMPVCKRVRKNAISQYCLCVSTENKVAKIQSSWLCGISRRSWIHRTRQKAFQDAWIQRSYWILLSSNRNNSWRVQWNDRALQKAEKKRYRVVCYSQNVGWKHFYPLM